MMQSDSRKCLFARPKVAQSAIVIWRWLRSSRHRSFSFPGDISPVRACRLGTTRTSKALGQWERARHSLTNLRFRSLCSQFSNSSQTPRSVPLRSVAFRSVHFARFLRRRADATRHMSDPATNWQPPIYPIIRSQGDAYAVPDSDGDKKNRNCKGAIEKESWTGHSAGESYH